MLKGILKTQIIEKHWPGPPRGHDLGTWYLLRPGRSLHRRENPSTLEDLNEVSFDGPGNQPQQAEAYLPMRSCEEGERGLKRKSVAQLSNLSS